MDQCVQFIADYQRGVFDIAELARRYGISRKTAYKWIERYEIGGPAELVDRSRRPAHCPHRTPYGAKKRPRLGRCWSSLPSSLRLCRLRCSSSSSRSLAG